MKSLRNEIGHAKKLDLNLLRVFVELYQVGSVTQVANLSTTSPSSVSQFLNKLRRQFDDVLFIRGGSRLVPTPKAEAIYALLHRDMDNLIRNLQGMLQKDVLNEIIVHCPPSLSLRILPELNKLIWKVNPQCNIVHKSSLETTKLWNDSVSLRLTELWFDYKYDISNSKNSIKIINEELCFICSGSNPINKKTLTPEQAELENFVLFEHFPGECNLHLFSRKGDFSVQTESFFSLLSMVQGSNHIGIVPVYMYETFGGVFDIRRVDTTIELPVLSVYLSYPTRNILDDLLKPLTAHFNAI